MKYRYENKAILKLFFILSFNLFFFLALHILRCEHFEIDISQINVTQGAGVALAAVASYIKNVFSALH